MESVLQLTIEPSLQKVFTSLMDSFKEISEILRFQTSDKQTGTKNVFGDTQLDSDLAADNLIFENLKKTGVVAYGLSEEKPFLTELGGQEYIVTFDPLDGSSIIGSNWTVGTIFAIWKNDERKLIGMTGEDAIGAGICMYGPRTTCLLSNLIKLSVNEFTLKKNKNGEIFWDMTKENIKIEQKTKLFAPANLRAVNEHAPYKKLVDYWISNKYTLRYTGGMVPDIYQIFIKGSGIFANPVTKESPAKLRYLYEVAPLAFLVEMADGKTTDGTNKSATSLEIKEYDQRSGLVCGSVEEIERLFCIEIYNQ